MIKYNLPFSRKFIDMFSFNLKETANADKSGKIFFVNGFRYEIVEQVDINEKLLLFGYFKGVPCYVVYRDKLSNGINIMGRGNNEENRSIAGVAMAALKWSEENKFCGKCGEKLYFMQQEIGKICKNCNFKIYPRLNPAVIVLVKRGEEFLLTRKREWQKDRYGLVAGFLEYGENAEEGVIREVYEETGLQIKNVRYIKSQFWPFPYQMMLGFFADYVAGEIKIDRNELEEVKWFNKKKLPLLPPKASISRYLIDVSL